MSEQQDSTVEAALYDSEGRQVSSWASGTARREADGSWRVTAPLRFGYVASPVTVTGATVIIDGEVQVVPFSSPEQLNGRFDTFTIDSLEGDR